MSEEKLLTEDEICTLAETDIHAALVQPNAPVGLLMNELYTCLETIQENPVYAMVLLESMEFAAMVQIVLDARHRLRHLNYNACPICCLKPLIALAPSFLKDA